MVQDLIVIASVSGGFLGIVCGVVSMKDALRERQVTKGMSSLLTERAKRIALLESENFELREAEANAAKVRKAIARAGGIARGIQRRKARDAAVRNTVDALASTPLRPRDEVVAGARGDRSAKACM